MNGVLTTKLGLRKFIPVFLAKFFVIENSHPMCYQCHRLKGAWQLINLN